MANIEWRPIQGASGYEISDTGEIRSHKGKNPKILAQFNKKGYLCVNLRLGKGSGYISTSAMRQAYVHELVLETFVCPRPEGMQGHHIDRDIRNNDLSNLAWVTSRENSLHRRQVRLTYELAEEIRAQYDLGKSQQKLAWEYDISQSHVSRIIRDVSWKAN
jgi:HNH endonuclease/NUMOD4 motif